MPQIYIDVMFYWYCGFWVMLGLSRDEDDKSNLSLRDCGSVAIYPLVFIFGLLDTITKEIYFTAAAIIEDIKEKNKEFKKRHKEKQRIKK